MQGLGTRRPPTVRQEAVSGASVWALPPAWPHHEGCPGFMVVCAAVFGQGQSAQDTFIFAIKTSIDFPTDRCPRLGWGARSTRRGWRAS